MEPTASHTTLPNKGEALIRWQHPERGLVSPVEFVLVAESIGLIVEIGDWVFRTAARQVHEWRQNGLPNLQVSVNKSPVQFQCRPGLARDWGDCLAKMREIGLKVSLDDFGTGYSSLSYLQCFDIDFVKIDQSFMKELRDGSKNLTLCKAIVRMSQELNMQVIAEGVETELQYNLLAQAGCNFGQGFLFSRPLAAIDFEAFCKRNSRSSFARA